MDKELIERLAHQSGALNCRSGITPPLRTFARLIAEECAKLSDAQAERDDNAAADIALAILEKFK